MSESWNQGNPQGPNGPYGQNPNQPPPGYGVPNPGQPSQPGYGAPGSSGGYGGYGGQTPPSPPSGMPPGGMPPGAGGGYPQPSFPSDPYGNATVGGEHPEGTKALVLSIIGLVCCWPLAVWAFFIARNAKNSGSTDGKIKAAFIISIIAVVLGVVGMLFGGILSLTGALVDSGTSGGSFSTDW